MENFLHPEDPLFKLFYYLGFVAIVVVLWAGSFITYDWWKEKRDKEREEGDGSGRGV